MCYSSITNCEAHTTFDGRDLADIVLVTASITWTRTLRTFFSVTKYIGGRGGQYMDGIVQSRPAI